MDTQIVAMILGALVACAGAGAKAFTWAVKYVVDRWTKARDDGTKALVDATASDKVLTAKLDENTAAIRQLTERMASLDAFLRDSRAQDAAHRVRSVIGGKERAG